MSNIILNANEKYTATMTYDNHIFKLYLNGVLAKEQELSGTIMPSSVPFFLGANPGVDGVHSNYSNVKIYQAQIYNQSITTEEIKAINEGRNLKTEGLLKYVDFTNKSYETNEIIPESVIESYFVWIPKYRYQLWDLGMYDSLTSIDTSKVHEISIIFGDYNTSDSVEGECTTPMESGTSGNCNIGDYITHPAFLSIPSKGFWVGKFETGYEGATTVVEAEVNEKDASKIIVKPNVYSWRGIQVANAFFTSYDYKRNLDSHMMKNTEWGAIAYLQHSKYGSRTSVRLNNNSAFITGYQANNEPTCGYTGTNEECNRYCNDKSCNVSYPNSVLASTTNNISGIFDMSGGAAEYVMSFVKDNNNNYIIGRHNEATSGFKGILGCPTCDNNSSGIIEIKDGENIPSSNYYDIYINTTNNNYDYFNRILGDATGEMGPFWRLNSRNLGSWYSNHSFYIRPHQPFYQRGGYYENGMEPGMFYFGLANGSIYETNTFRLVLTPTI